MAEGTFVDLLVLSAGIANPFPNTLFELGADEVGTSSSTTSTAQCLELSTSTTSPVTAERYLCS